MQYQLEKSDGLTCDRCDAGDVKYFACEQRDDYNREFLCEQCVNGSQPARTVTGRSLKEGKHDGRMFRGLGLHK